MRFRITVIGDDPEMELRGYLGHADPDEASRRLGAFSEAMKPYGVVIASVAHPLYNPFTNPSD